MKDFGLECLGFVCLVFIVALPVAMVYTVVHFVIKFW